MSTTTADDEAETTSEGSVQVTVAVLFGVVLALVGVLGPIVGGAEGELVVFGRNYLHDAVHLLSGLAGLAAGYFAGSRGETAANYNRWLGVVYLFVALFGFVATETAAALLNINLADNLLHLGLAVAFLAVGFVLGESGESE